MGNPYNDDTCSGCGGYNNRLVFCDECVRDILAKAGLSWKEAQKLVKDVTGEKLYDNEYLNE